MLFKHGRFVAGEEATLASHSQHHSIRSSKVAHCEALIDFLILYDVESTEAFTGASSVLLAVLNEMAKELKDLSWRFFFQLPKGRR